MSAVATAGVAASVQRPLTAVMRDYLALTKPRIIVLLELTTLAPMIVIAHGWPGWRLVIMTMLGGWLASGGAGAVNCWFDRDIDAEMGRTRNRPVPAGRIRPAAALSFGLTLGALAFVVLATTVNLLSALLAMTGFGFYTVIYTMLLKRTSSQNIVIGGAAGAIPPLVGCAAVSNSLGLTALYMFAIVFYWTPPHFWALSLLLSRDYANAGVPMLPVVEGHRRTQTNILLYTVILTVVTMLPFATRTFGVIYLIGTLALDAGFLIGATGVIRHRTARGARRLYYYSLLYLALLFSVMALDSVLRLG